MQQRFNILISGVFRLFSFSIHGCYCTQIFFIAQIIQKTSINIKSLAEIYHKTNKDTQSLCTIGETKTKSTS